MDISDDIKTAFYPFTTENLAISNGVNAIFPMHEGQCSHSISLS